MKLLKFYRYHFFVRNKNTLKMKSLHFLVCKTPDTLTHAWKRKTWIATEKHKNDISKQKQKKNKIKYKNKPNNVYEIESEWNIYIWHKRNGRLKKKCKLDSTLRYYKKKLILYSYSFNRYEIKKKNHKQVN